MRTTKRFYIGEILDLYKKGNSSRYGSVESTHDVSQLAWLSLRVYLPLQMSAASVSLQSRYILFVITEGAQRTMMAMNQVTITMAFCRLPHRSRAATKGSARCTLMHPSMTYFTT